VLSFAFEADVAVVDTNVGRVLARVNGRRLTAREAQHAADAALPAGRSWAWNSAMLDLGALVCTARSPGCGRCPVASVCAWRGGPDVDPAVGSAGVSGRQARFAGSDRQGRGRLMRAMAAAPVALDDLAAVTGWSDDPDRAHRAAESLVRDGLAVWDGAVSGSHGSIRLP
jgi:A/G-specific adenine glycosylase